MQSSFAVVANLHAPQGSSKGVQ